MRRTGLLSPWGSLLPVLALLLAAAAPPAVAGAACAAGASGAGGRPLSESVQTTRAAAEAILAQSGTEHCLRGKLTNALLGLSKSCEVHGKRSELCVFADRVVVTTGWSVAFMETTARQLLQLSSADPTSPSPAVSRDPQP